MNEPWMEAYTQRIVALKKLREIHANVESVRRAADRGDVKARLTYEKYRVLSEYKPDLDALEHADAFAWMNPALAAVQEAAKTVPIYLPLRDLRAPAAFAWWWFTPPLNIRSINDPDVPVSGLLWYFMDPDTLRFSVYVLSPDLATTPVPSTTWTWPIDDSLETMLHMSRRNYRRAYGPVGPYAGTDEDLTIGEEGTLFVIERLSRLFLAACVWLDQKILEAPTGHVERHARKRAQKELKLREPPVVRVIALRHTERGRHEGASTTTDGRTYNCQWVVSGHWRKQPYGPGRQGRRLTFIHPFVKGPDDKPIRSKSDKLYVVMK